MHLTEKLTVFLGSSPQMEEIFFIQFLFDAPLGGKREGQTDEDTETLGFAIIVIYPGGGTETMVQ
jgi:hypothetical protein